MTMSTAVVAAQPPGRFSVRPPAATFAAFVRIPIGPPHDVALPDLPGRSPQVVRETLAAGPPRNLAAADRYGMVGDGPWGRRPRRGPVLITNGAKNAHAWSDSHQPKAALPEEQP